MTSKSHKPSRKTSKIQSQQLTNCNVTKNCKGLWLIIAKMPVAFLRNTYGRILKANLSWTQKKVELEWCKNIFICLIWTKSRTSVTQVWVLSG